MMKNVINFLLKQFKNLKQLPFVDSRKNPAGFYLYSLLRNSKKGSRKLFRIIICCKLSKLYGSSQLFRILF
jgi:hypothetical protein